MGCPARGASRKPRAVPSLVSDAEFRKAFRAPGWRVGLSPLQAVTSLLGSPCMMEGENSCFVNRAGLTRSIGQWMCLGCWDNTG